MRREHHRGSVCDFNSSKLIQGGIRRGVLSERLSLARGALLVLLLLVVVVLARYPPQRCPRDPLRDLLLLLARLRPPLLLPIRSWSSSALPYFSWLSPVVLLSFQHSHPKAIVAHPIQSTGAEMWKSDLNWARRLNWLCKFPSST